MAALNCSITRLDHEADAQRCAHLMASSEPWLTLGRTYEACLAIVQDPTREVYLIKIESDLAGFLIVCMTGAFVGYIQTICIDPDPARPGAGQQAGGVCRTTDSCRVAQRLPLRFILQSGRTAPI